MARAWLQLAPEMGGFRYGPFVGTIRLGSDRARCAVPIDPAWGVLPCHARLDPTPTGTYRVTPEAPNAPVFVLSAGQHTPWPIGSGTEVRPGDAIIVASPGGPRFTVEVEAIAAAPAPTAAKRPQSAPPSAAPANKGGPTAPPPGAARGVPSPTRPPPGMAAKVFGPAERGTVKGEIARRGQAELIAKNPMFRDAYNFWVRFRASPDWGYLLVAIAVALIGLVGAGAFSFGGVVWTIWSVVHH